MKQGKLLVLSVAILAGFSFPGDVFGKKPSIYVPPPRGESHGSDSETDSILLTNKDRLSGDVLSIDRDGRITIKHSLLGTDVIVPMKAARSVTFGGRTERLSTGKDCVTMTSGDSFSGKVRALTSDKLMLETGDAGTLSINRRMVAAVGLGSGGRVVLRDDFSEGMEGWTPHGGTWVVKDGALRQSQYGSHFISRRMDQSGPMVFEWVMASTSSSQLSAGAAIFCSGTASMYGRNSYCVFMNGNSVSLYRVRDNSSKTVANKHLRRNFSMARCKLEYDPDSGAIALRVNGEDVVSYKDPSPLKKGTFFHLSAGQPTSFDEVRVTRGSGRLGVRGGVGTDRDVVFFSNGDRTTGNVRSISGEKLDMKTSFGHVGVDISNVSFMEFGRTSMEEPRRRAGDARIVLSNHDALTVQVLSLDAGVLKGYMDCAGNISIRRSAILRMMFNIYD